MEWIYRERFLFALSCLSGLFCGSLFERGNIVIIEDRVRDFINSFDKEDEEFICELEKRAREEYVPIIRQETKNLLRFFLKLKRPKRILEVGAAIGFSSIYMSQYIEKDAKIITIENYEKRIVEARESIKLAGKEGCITLLEGDAQQVLKTLDEPFDFIFMDAAKGQYLNFLPDIMRLLRKDGILISDNVLQEGDVMESRYAIKRRNHTIHHRMREYMYQITHMEELETLILPTGDGATVSVRI